MHLKEEEEISEEWKKPISMSQILKYHKNESDFVKKVRSLLLPLRDSFVALRELGLNEKYKFFEVFNSTVSKFITILQVAGRKYHVEGRTVKEATYTAADMALKDIVRAEEIKCEYPIDLVNVLSPTTLRVVASNPVFPWHIIVSYAIYKYCEKNEIDMPIY